MRRVFLGQSVRDISNTPLGLLHFKKECRQKYIAPAEFVWPSRDENANDMTVVPE
jgi:hypothetical protein